MSVIQIGSLGGNGPYMSDYGLMFVEGDTVRIRFWDGWPEEKIEFNRTNKIATAAALAYCKKLQARVHAEREAAYDTWRAKPWWWRLFNRRWRPE